MILIIDKSKANAKKYADTLYYLGIPTLALTPSEALSGIRAEFCAVIMLNAHLLPDIHDYIRRIREYAYNTPVFAICNDKSSFPSAHLFDRVYKSTYVSQILDDMRAYCKQRSLKPPGDFRLSGIDASITLLSTTFLWKPISFTRTENMILRVFIASYPRTLSAKELLTLAFKKSRVPEPSNIRAHISLMNKKFREISGKNLIASSPSESGYQILTPEIQEERKKATLG